MAGQMSGVRAKINELWESKIVVDEQLCALKNQILEENISESLAAEVAIQQSAVSFINFRLCPALAESRFFSRMIFCRYHKWRKMNRSSIF